MQSTCDIYYNHKGDISIMCRKHVCKRQKHAYWKKVYKSILPYITHKCTNCLIGISIDNLLSDIENYAYCPNCHAKMDVITKE